MIETRLSKLKGVIYTAIMMDDPITPAMSTEYNTALHMVDPSSFEDGAYERYEEVINSEIKRILAEDEYGE